MIIPTDVVTWLLIALPILFIDWQLAIIWVLTVSNPSAQEYFATLQYGGIEVFMVYIVLAFVRVILFRRSQ